MCITRKTVLYACFITQARNIELLAMIDNGAYTLSLPTVKHWFYIDK